MHPLDSLYFQQQDNIQILEDDIEEKIEEYLEYKHVSDLRQSATISEWQTIISVLTRIAQAEIDEEEERNKAEIEYERRFSRDYEYDY